MTSNIDSDMYYAVSGSAPASIAVEHMFKAPSDVLPYLTTLGENVYIAQRFKFNNIAVGKNTVDFIDKIKFADTENFSVVDIPVTDWQNINRVKPDGTIIPAISPADKEDFYVVYKLKEPIAPEIYSPVATIIYSDSIVSFGYENLIYFKKLNDDTGIIEFTRDTAIPLTEEKNETKSETVAYNNSKEGYYFGVIDVSEPIEIVNDNTSGTLNDKNEKTNTHQFVVGETSDITLRLSKIQYNNAIITVKLQMQDKNVYKDCTYTDSIKTYTISNNDNIEINYNDISKGNYQIAISLSYNIKGDPAGFSYSIDLSNNYQINKYLKELSFDIAESSSYLIKLNSTENLEDMYFEIYDITDPSNKYKISSAAEPAVNMFLPKTGYNFNLAAGKKYQITVNYNKANPSSTYDFKIERTFSEVIGKNFVADITGNCFRICVSGLDTNIKLIDENNKVLFSSIDYNGFKIVTPYSEGGSYYFDINTLLLQTGKKYTVLTQTPDRITGIQSGNKTINDSNRYTKAENEYEIGDMDERSKFGVNVVDLNNLM
jgi:hypothetical protein